MKLLIITILLAFSGFASAASETAASGQLGSGAGDPKCWCKTCNAMVSCKDNQANAQRNNSVFDKRPGFQATAKQRPGAKATKVQNQ